MFSFHCCMNLGCLIRQPLIKNLTLLPWVKRWPFLNSFINEQFLSSILSLHLWAHGIRVAPETTFVSAHPTLPHLHPVIEWPVTVQMKPLVIMWIAQPLNFASRNGRFHTSSAQHAEWFPEAYAVRQTGVKFASAARNNYIVSLQHRPACGESSWLQENARREKERNPNSSMPRCGIVRASKSSQTLRSAGARGSLWTTFIPKCTAPFAPAGANVHHTRLGEQKEPHEWRSVNVERVG